MDKRNNRVINEIMSNSASTILVLSSSDCASTVFLSELSNRYPTTFWFNTEFDDVYSFSLEIAGKVINDKALLHKMMQLMYCDNDKIDNIIINVVLEDIKKRQGDCLFVFENMEKLPATFDFSLLEVLIKNCPKNLKIILISEKLINLNYNKLEMCAPKIVDEFALGINLQSTVVDIDTSDLSTEDIQFLNYISLLGQAPVDLVTQIYPNGVSVLRYISIKYPSLVINKGNCCFGLSVYLHKIVVEKCKNLPESPYKEDVFDLLYNFYEKKGKYMNALRIALRLDKLDYIKETLVNISHDGGYLYRLYEFGKYKENSLNEKYITVENWDCYAYAAICDAQMGRYKDSMKKIEKLMTIKEFPREAALRCYYLKVKVLIQLGEFNRCIDFIKTITKENYDLENIKFFEKILCFLPELFRNTDQIIQIENFKNCERYITNDANDKSLLYIKMLQSMSEAYFNLGNCRKAIAMVQKIKDIIPFYVVPYRLYQYFYYMNDPVFAEKIGQEALIQAKEYEITRDIASIYLLLNKIYSFWGMKKEAIMYVDKAAECEDSCEYIKYYAVAVRVMTYARFSKKEFAKDIALIYSKQCEELNIRQNFMLYGSISYWYWHNGQKEEAQFYANKCLTSTNSKSGLWMIASGVAINYALEDESNEDLRIIITRFFYTAEQYAMDMVLTEFDSLYSNIIKYALSHNINTAYVTKIQNAIKSKEYKDDNGTKIKIQVMGNTAISVDGAEIQWKTKKARELFIIYVLNGDAGIDRAKIFSLLWSEYIYESAINNLKTTNNIIRNTLNEYAVDYRLEYKNSKYILTLNNSEFDYDKYLKTVEKFEKETVLAEKINLMLDIVNLFGTGFAPDLVNTEFKEINHTLKQNLCLSMIELIKILADKGRLIDARKFLNALSRIDDAGKYQEVVAKFDERKHL